MLSPLHHSRSKPKLLSIKDYVWLKSEFIQHYGFVCWKESSLKEFFELLPEMQKVIAKKENMRLSTLKYYGVKNPK